MVYLHLQPTAAGEGDASMRNTGKGDILAAKRKLALRISAARSILLLFIIKITCGAPFGGSPISVLGQYLVASGRRNAAMGMLRQKSCVRGDDGRRYH
jgi:hypothetical protein